MSSATASLFASVALAAIGAAGFAYTLTHPGFVANLANRLVAETPAPGNDIDTANAIPGSNPNPVAAESAGTASIPAGAYGHFETEAEINGRSVDVMVDTGASLVALTYEDASRLGIYVNPSDFTHIAKTANGTARVAPVTISRISIGDITVRDVPAVVSERGKSERTLLGMSFLGRLSRVEMRGGTLVLQE
ncbi:retropepsin-like aspartic protease family protein [Hyphomicrobium sp.]|jgi:aspartyl protease family protein|uniref:retropepsin-like aspartic protease family protein n=1 Tax=Hyphomicrobium sp. TaxID=82 RepID=UPI002C414572|nr:TIGR02281 family clan AA aspartic protease [Hyphomicrobium sp.]HVZ05181.1 TIGR02281 family clan AA aspartic protease [Hyphomicrobium sp.]